MPSPSGPPESWDCCTLEVHGSVLLGVSHEEEWGICKYSAMTIWLVCISDYMCRAIPSRKCKSVWRLTWERHDWGKLKKAISLFSYMVKVGHVRHRKWQIRSPSDATLSWVVGNFSIFFTTGRPPIQPKLSFTSFLSNLYFWFLQIVCHSKQLDIIMN
jgi:hypothetical protein